MKKYLSVLLIMLLPVSAMSQEEADSSYLEETLYYITDNFEGDCGLIKANIGLTNYTSRGYGYKPGTKFGVGAQLRYSELFLQLFLMLSNKGTAAKLNQFVHQTYFEIPVMVGIDFARISSVRLYASGGVYGAVGIVGLSVDGKHSKSVFSNQNTWGEKIRRLDYGVVIGVGANCKKYIIGAELEMGLRDLVKRKETDISQGSAPRNVGISVTLAYKI